jgi:hypothetical protein
MGEMCKAYRKPEGRRLLGRTICTWQYSIKMDLKEIG